MNPISAFRSIQQDLIRNYDLPFAVSLCVKGLTLVHWVWWLHRKRKLVQPENIIPAALGTVLEGGLRFTPNIIEQAVRGVAKLILIATRIDESVKRMQCLSRAFTHLKEAVMFKYPLVHEPQWNKNPESIVYSVRTSNQWNLYKTNFKSYIKRIYYCLLSLFVKTFKLGMQLWDTYHAFVFPHDAIPELFVNGMYWYRKIRNNKDYLNAKLQEYRPLIQNIFDATHSLTSADNLIEKTQMILNVADFAAQGVEKAKQLKHQGKKIVSLFKSQLLGKDLRVQPAHTPFVLNSRPQLNWALHK